MPHMWHQNVPRKQIPLECLGQNTFIQVRTTELRVLTIICFTETPEYRGAHFIKGKAQAGRGEGFAAQMEPEENWEVAPVSCVLSHSCSNATQTYFQVLWIRKVNGKTMMWDTGEMHIHQTPCLNSAQSAREGTTHAETRGMNDTGSLISRAPMWDWNDWETH